jgi:hypothetical protein
MCFFGSNSAPSAPTPPALPEPPAPPDKVDIDGKKEIVADKARAAKQDREKQLRNMKGQQSTMKTGPRGLLQQPEDVTYKKLLGA